MLSISYWADKVSIKILINEKFIEDKAYTFGICNDLVMRGKSRIHRPYASLIPAEVFLTPAELRPASEALS